TYAEYEGTSMAAPHVSGVVALMLGEQTMTPTEVLQRLQAAAWPLRHPCERGCGAGLLDAGRSADVMAPLAVADAYEALAGSPLVVAAPGLLANDASPIGQTSTVQLVSPPQGALTLQPDGAFTYTAPSSFLGIDRFTYRAVAA